MGWKWIIWIMDEKQWICVYIMVHLLPAPSPQPEHMLERLVAGLDLSLIPWCSGLGAGGRARVWCVPTLVPCACAVGFWLSVLCVCACECECPCDPTGLPLEPVYKLDLLSFPHPLPLPLPVPLPPILPPADPSTHPKHFDNHGCLLNIFLYSFWTWYKQNEYPTFSHIISCLQWPISHIFKRQSYNKKNQIVKRYV